MGGLNRLDWVDMLRFRHICHYVSIRSQKGLHSELPKTTFKDFIQKFQTNHKAISVKAIRTACLYVLTHKHHTTAHSLSAQASHKHCYKIHRHVLCLYTMLEKQSDHHVVIGSNLVIKRVKTMFLKHLSASIERRMSRHESEA